MEKGEKFKFDPIGTGPFMLKDYIPRKKCVEVRHPRLFQGQSQNLIGLQLWFMLDASSREMAFRNRARSISSKASASRHG